MKKFLALFLCGVMLFALAACATTPETPDDTTVAGDTTAPSIDGPVTAPLSVGAILVGDETEGYSLAHINGIDAAVAKLAEENIAVNVEYKKKVPETTDVATNANQLIANGCSVIITNSYGHQFNFGSVIEENPDVTFVSMTGDLAASSGLANYKNAFTKVYESRYVSGIVAGLKLKALIDAGDLTAEKAPNAFDADGNIKIGYVGAYNYAEVVSGYTAFFLGIKSVVSNISMTVKYTNSWFSEEREAAVAEYLLNQGCVIIGQHADSTGAPAAVEKAFKNGNNLCFSVGYNVTMLDVAEDVALTSASNVWSVYYYYLFKSIAEGTEVATNWADGYASDAVEITELGKACAEGTADAVNTAIAAIKDGSLKVFDVANFTVGGETITSYTGAYGMDGAEALKTEGDVTYFDESALRSAPYFDIRIDGITEEVSDYAD